MAFTQADLEKIEAAIAGGSIQSMSFEGQSFTFRTVDDLLKLRSIIVAELNGGKTRYRLASTSKGV